MFRLAIVCVLLLLYSCAKEKHTPISDILVLGHIYQWGEEGNRIDHRLENLDYKKYAGVWLLGDVCSATCRERATLEYLDGIFDLRNPSTRWAVGNHDIRDGNIHYITEATGRQLYYGGLSDSIAVYVLNSQMQHPIFVDSCSYKQRQHEHFNTFLDSVIHSNAYHSLFILSHNPVWADAEESLQTYELIGNAQAGWIDLICEWNGEFRNQYLDKLIAVQRKGVQVYCIAGDGGQYRKTFHVRAESGIEYLVTGINNSFLEVSDDPALSNRFDIRADSVLLLKYEQSSTRFTPEFIPLNNLK